MAIELKMPALSPTMEQGTLAKWLVNEGDSIKAGDLIAEIETDKATMEFEAVDEGRVARLVVPEGTDSVAVGTVIAVLAEDGDVAPQTSPIVSVACSGTEVASKTRTSAADRTRVSPLAQRIAQAQGIDLAGIAGTGPNGRIVRADLGVAPLVAPLPTPKLAEAAVIVAPPPAGVPVETVRLSGMRRTIADRLTKAKQTIPHFYLTAKCNIDPLLKLRQDLNASLAAQNIKLSVNDLLIKAMALSLMRVPDANVQFGGEELHRFGRVDIAMAVAIDGGLVTPVIKDAAGRSISAIAQESKVLVANAREGRLTPEDYQGGTASISNPGMFGIDEIFPVINPPQAVIVGIGAGVEPPWKVGVELGLATIMSATASFDHRAIDGAIAAQFMAAFRDLVESPLQIVS